MQYLFIHLKSYRNHNIQQRYHMFSSYRAALIMTPSLVWVKAVCVCVEGQSSRREQTPLDPAVSPWRVTGLWINLLNLKMKATNLLRKSEDLSNKLSNLTTSTNPNFQMFVFVKEGRREQTPLDPAVSPWRVAGLWINLLNLKMDAPPERRGRMFKLLKTMMTSWLSSDSNRSAGPNK